MISPNMSASVPRTTIAINGKRTGDTPAPGKFARIERDWKDGDRIEIDIPARSIHLAVDEAELKRRREAMLAKGDNAWKPAKRARKVSTARKAYAALTTSAARGAVRVVKD